MLSRPLLSGQIFQRVALLLQENTFHLFCARAKKKKSNRDVARDETPARRKSRDRRRGCVESKLPTSPRTFLEASSPQRLTEFLSETPLSAALRKELLRKVPCVLTVFYCIAAAPLLCASHSSKQPCTCWMNGCQMSSERKLLSLSH